MSKLYKCDNCGEHVEQPRKTFKEEMGGMNNIGTKLYEAYHVCEDCWDELGWDND